MTSERHARAGPASADAAPVPSPCTNVCRMDDSSGFCAGCWRTIDEIVAWAVLDDEARRAVWRRLEARRRGGEGGAA